MAERPEEFREAVAAREDMATFLDLLSVDAAEQASEWENLHIFDMLESMAAWLRDTTGHENFSHPELAPEQWRFVPSFFLRDSTTSRRRCRAEAGPAAGVTRERRRACAQVRSRRDAT